MILFAGCADIDITGFAIRGAIVNVDMLLFYTILC
jgi:hypothetical protein